MATLYEISEEFQRLYGMADECDLSQEDIADTVESLECELADKADGYAITIRSLEGDIAMLKMEIERLTARKRTIENNIRNMKRSLELAMRAAGKEKIKTKLFSFGIQRNQPSLVIDDPRAIPEKFLIPQEPKVDNAAVKKMLKGLDEHEFCLWAHLENSESLRIR